MKRQQKQDPVSPFWKEPDTVDRFANRDPDLRLVQLLSTFTEPPTVRVLDLGCAGGRNTVLLASNGFDFQALDGSRPMVARTRERIAPICGTTAARQRVRHGEMQDLSEFPSDSFHVVIALGIYHQALSLEQWHSCVAESGRLLKEGGFVLVSTFTPDSQPEGEPLQPVQELPDMYDGFSSGPLCLFSVEDHDQAMVSHGLEPHVPTETVRVETELGYRITMNALYRKCGADHHSC
ncbi:class I SAM-dependent methyltransferase [Gemmatimonadota bacterium]